MTKLKQPKRKRSEHTRESDMNRKQRNRHTTQMLLRGLWDLEARARQRESPGTPPRRNRDTMQSVLEATVNRIRGIQGQPPLPTTGNNSPHSPLSACGARPCRSPNGGAHEGSEETLCRPRSVCPDDPAPDIGLGTFTEVKPTLSGGDIRKGLLESRTLGVLYVCVEDWFVRSSSFAMGLVCPWEPVRGYEGQDLSLMMHPDDHLQLQILKEQLGGFKPGDTRVLSVRLMRACQDGDVLVTAYARQIFEVAYVAPDTDHDDELHVLFTCVLDGASVKPLTFGADERQVWRDAASMVSGCMLIDHQRSTESLVKMSAIARDRGVANGNDSQITDFLMGVSGRLGRAFGINDMVKWVRDHAMSALSGVVRSHVLVGLAPNGVPWLQKACSLVAFGFMSKYRPYVYTSLSGHLVSLSAQRSVSYAVRLCGSEEIASVSFCWEPGGGRTTESKRRLFTVGHSLWSEDERGAMHGHDVILIKKHPAPIPQRFDIRYTRTGPPVPELVEQFLKFTKPFSGLPIGFSGIDD